MVVVSRPQSLAGPGALCCTREKSVDSQHGNNNKKCTLIRSSLEMPVVDMGTEISINNLLSSVSGLLLPELDRLLFIRHIGVIVGGRHDGGTEEAVDKLNYLDKEHLIYTQSV